MLDVVIIIKPTRVVIISFGPGLFSTWGSITRSVSLVLPRITNVEEDEDGVSIERYSYRRERLMRKIEKREQRIEEIREACYVKDFQRECLPMGNMKNLQKRNNPVLRNACNRELYGKSNRSMSQNNKRV